MELLDRYGKQLTAEERLASLMSASSLEATDSSSGVVAGMLTVLLALAATIAAGCIGPRRENPTNSVTQQFYNNFMLVYQNFSHFSTLSMLLLLIHLCIQLP
uniref:Uncharacterized protein n=1 Tax=Cuerna arida TaxID=1464854 RepID=A0A1B6GEJ5_9HEMI